jgi:hypothetical protein
MTIHGPGKVYEEEQWDLHVYVEAAVGEAMVREANAGRLNAVWCV